MTAGTLFADTHKPWRIWFDAIWHVANQKSGVSALVLQRALGLGSYHSTAWSSLHKLRRAMVWPGRNRLAGVVQVDETYTGGSESGTQIQTDDWNGYAGLKDLGYEHRAIRPTADLGENLLPRANRIAALLKRCLLGTHHGAVSPDHLDYYLDEYTFRFNRLTSRSRGLLFYRLMEQAVALEPV